MEEAKEISPQSKEDIKEENPVAVFLYTLGGIEIFAGLMIAIYMGQLDYEWQWGTFLVWFLPTLVSGLLIVGFAEVIKLLHLQNISIKKQLDIMQGKK
ncbi:hypothetical protein [Halobacillus amylolyticus]|uniref:Uncharacterized protein n=1 Tax=Halobacillus amylolyticus TaxID=2932259 RepID=A0ABY4HBF1_9BACI|nr:hypothetical protein [Halobacillus amylolyticus]UOR12189.1 hypothetical protein MUO15_01225 [Halobacillus amylolyticus]